MRTFGENLRARRKFWRIQLKDFAKIIGVDIATLINYEKNRTYPNVLVAHDMARALGCTIDDLLTGGDKNER